MGPICNIAVLLGVAVVVNITAAIGDGKPSKLTGTLAQLKNHFEQNAASRTNQRIIRDAVSQSHGKEDDKAESRRIKRYLPFIFGGKCGSFSCSNSGNTKPQKYGSKGFDSDRYDSEEDNYWNYNNYDSSGDLYDYYSYYSY